MPLQKLQFRPGLNREGTDYANEGGWYDGDKIRFRSGFPEKIGGWSQFSSNTFIGTARSLWVWLNGDSGVGELYTGVGTNAKYYIFSAGSYNDITPYSRINVISNPFTTVNGSNIVTVLDTQYSPNAGDYVTFSGASVVGGLTLNGNFQVIAVTSPTTYTITTTNPATSSAGPAGGSVTASYEYPVGSNFYTVGLGWGAGPWGGPSAPVTQALGNNPFASTVGSSLLTVTQNAHGMVNGTYVAFTGATAFGVITAGMLNNTFVISSVTTNTYQITLPNTLAGSFITGQRYVITFVGTTSFTSIGAAANTVGTAFTATGPGTGTGTASFAASSATSGGGSNVVATEQSGARGWGTAFSSGVGTQLRLWTNDNYGADLVIAPRGGSVFYWSDIGGLSNRAVLLNTLADNTTALTAAATFPVGVTNITVPATSAAFIYPYMKITGTNIPAGAFVAPSYLTGDTNVAISAVTTSTTVATFAATFLNGATTITVDAGTAALIYAGLYVSGTNLPTGTQIAPGYVTGATTVPITTTTTGANSGTYTFFFASSGTYNFSYAGSFVPSETFQVVASAIQEFIICFGAESYVPGDPNEPFNPMLVRWSDQGNAYQWIPTVTNQSGEYLLTKGSFIMGARTTRQEILVWTDSAIYSMQYLGAPYVWGFQILMDNISIMSPNCMITVNNITYWMGKDRFYQYSGRVEVLPCALRQFIFNDINQDQAYQVFAGANEAYNEIWWFYVSESSSNTIIDKYVIYNYLDRVWYYGTLSRTAWLQTGTQQYPIAASYFTNSVFTGSINGSTLTVTEIEVGTLAIGQQINSPNVSAGTTISALGTGTGGTGTYTVNLPQVVDLGPLTSSDGTSILLNHEFGNDDLSTSATLPINAYIQSSDFDIGDGHNFGFVWRILPDINFNGSSINEPKVTLTIRPRVNSGTPYGTSDDSSVQSAQNYTVLPQYTIQEFDGQVYTRIRGRQMAFRIESSTIGVAWQLGSPRIDIRPDGRR